MEEEICGDSVNVDMAAKECAPVHQSSNNLKQAQTMKKQTAIGLLMSYLLSNTDPPQEDNLG